MFPSEPVKNGCLDKFLLISNYPSIACSLFTLSITEKARLTRKIACCYLPAYSRVFTVLLSISRNSTLHSIHSTIINNNPV